MKSTIGGKSLSTARSPPSRGAWIEILHFWYAEGDDPVAPLAGGVD